MIGMLYSRDGGAGVLAPSFNPNIGIGAVLTQPLGMASVMNCGPLNVGDCRSIAVAWTHATPDPAVISSTTIEVNIRRDISPPVF